MDNAPQATRTRVTARLRQLRFDAGSLSLNLIATVGRRPVSPIERLDGVDRLRDWCAGVGLVLRDEAATPAFLASLCELRAAAYQVAAAAVGERRPSPEAVDLLNLRARHAPAAPRLRLGPSGVCLDESSVRLSGEDLQALVARDLITLLGDPARRSRLKECDAENCRMIYLDPGRGKPRRWCSMQRCGNSAKVAEYRRRGAADAG